MERTYDVFVDNGLFVLSHYLNKPIKKITTEDIEESIPMISKKIESYIKCKKYSKLKTMVFSNSVISNNNAKNSLENELKNFISQKGEDMCMICGKNHANIKMNLKGRSYLPNRSANIFFNFSNNLHNLNICPYCLVLTVISIMNCRKDGYAYLYNSNSDSFMEEITSEMQKDNRRDILIDAEEVRMNKIELLEKIIDEDVLNGEMIELYKFNNSGQSDHIYDIDTIYSNNIRLLRILRNKSLLGEFKELGLGNMITNNLLNRKYMGYIYDSDKDKLICSQELLDVLKKEVTMLNEEMINLTKRIAKDISDAGIDIKKARNILKGIKNKNEYTNALMELNDLYVERNSKSLYSGDEYNKLIDYKIYKDIKNIIILELL